MACILQNGDTILFQGDSITDFGRGAPPGLGTGYVAMVRGLITAIRPDLDVDIVNRGVSGDRTAELLARWDADCLALRPHVLSIMIGVNDVWRKAGEWNGQKHIPLPEYRANLAKLVESALGMGSIRHLFLMSPTSITLVNKSGLNDLVGEYAETVKEFAKTYGAVYVPSHETTMAARLALPEVEWSGDGCHPAPAGHALLAAAWLRAAGVIA
ncbi:MAG: SGNH/GDSL hydrolase family protein [Kiritimatiellia bacterium]